MTTPTISTARLILRPLTKATTRNIAWLRDPTVTRYSEQRHSMHSLSSQLRYINAFVGNSHIWAVQLLDTGEHIGNVSAVVDEPNSVADVGIMIGETRQWRKGYATEAWVRACGWLLDKDGGDLRKLEAGCMRNNEGMLKIIRGSGFTQEGERLNHFVFEGNPISAVLFGRMR